MNFKILETKTVGVQFCKRSAISNQKPGSVVEFQSNGDKISLNKEASNAGF